MSFSKGHGHELLPEPEASKWRCWLIQKRLSIALLAAVIALVFAVRLLAVSKRPRDVQFIAAEVGAVAEFWGDPSPNHAGNRIVFQQSTENGVGIFLAEIPNGPRQLIFEQAEKGFDHRNFQVWGWSPDDRWFALSRRPDRESKREIVICHGKTGEIGATVAVERTVGELAWLSPQAFVYVDDYQELQRVEQLSEKKWSYPQAFKKPVGKKIKLTKEQQAVLPKIQGLAALANDTVVYQQGQVVWSWTFGMPEPVKLWEAGTANSLVDFSLDKDPNRLLLRCKNKEAELLSSFYLPTKYTSHFGTIPTPGHYTNRLILFNGNGYAYMRREATAKLLHIKSSPDSPAVELEFNAGLNNYVSSGRSIFIYGSRAGEPVGIWRYEAGLDSATCVVSNPQPRFERAVAINPARGMITNANGNVITYQIWSPPKAVPGKKYPFLIGKGSTRWQGYPVSIANAGAYFVSISNNSEDGAWEKNVMPLYEYLKSGLSIDPEKIYLYGASGSTQPVCDLLDKHPDVWRGAILFSPGVLPDLDRIKVPRLLIDCGGEDMRAEAVERYRDEAAQSGMEVTVAFHENAGHVYRSIASLRARDEAVMNFLFGR